MKRLAIKGPAEMLWTEAETARVIKKTAVELSELRESGKIKFVIIAGTPLYSAAHIYDYLKLARARET